MVKTVMVVDDSASIRHLVGITLRGASYEVIEAIDGEDALAKLNGQKINLIITDVNMPNMDGITLVKEIKKLPDYKFTPMILLTTEAAAEKRQEAREAGARAWLTKPFRTQALLTAVSKLILP